MINLLTNSPIFKDIPISEIENILNNTHHNIFKYSKNDLIAVTGEKVQSLMIIISGCIRSEMLDSSGKVFRMEDFQKSRIIAPGFLFGKTNTFPVNVVANCDTSVLMFPKKSFEIMLSQHSGIMLNYLDIISDKTQFLASKIKKVFLQSIEGKIANYLLTLSKNLNTNEFQMDKSQAWLAERFSVARPSVGRVFSKMNKNGIIESKGKEIKILDEKKLIKCINKF